jgi:hypothetical protein
MIGFVGALLCGALVAPAAVAGETTVEPEVELTPARAPKPPRPPKCFCESTVKPLDAFDGYDLIFFGQASFVGIGETGDTGPPDEFVEFSVEGIWKGPVQRRLRVHTTDGDPHCAFRFILGKRYLVYARHEKIAYSNRYRTSACARTAKASHSLPDLAILGEPGERLEE